MSYGRMVQAEAELTREVADWLDRAQREDAAEDAAHGADRRGDEPPEWMLDKQARLARIRATRAELEAEAKAAAAAKPAPATKPDGTPRVPRAASRRIRRAHRSPARSATSPIPRAGSCSGATASSKPTTRKPRSMPTDRSLSPIA